MKKIVQISLVLILVFVLFQAVAGSTISTGTVGSSTANSPSSALNAADDAQVTMECLIRVKGVICVRPNVGWNS